MIKSQLIVQDKINKKKRMNSYCIHSSSANKRLQNCGNLTFQMIKYIYFDTKRAINLNTGYLGQQLKRAHSCPRSYLFLWFDWAKALLDKDQVQKWCGKGDATRKMLKILLLTIILQSIKYQSYLLIFYAFNHLDYLDNSSLSSRVTQLYLIYSFSLWIDRSTVKRITGEINIQKFQAIIHIYMVEKNDAIRAKQSFQLGIFSFKHTPTKIRTTKANMKSRATKPVAQNTRAKVIPASLDLQSWPIIKQTAMVEARTALSQETNPIDRRNNNTTRRYQFVETNKSKSKLMHISKGTASITSLIQISVFS